MSAVLDHPDIEKLPLEVDGIPVRETIREIFRNPENGTPDNISKAGCLALALKSKEVGGGKSHLVWNAWRDVFPVITYYANGPLQYKNTIDFRKVDFEKVLFNLSHFRFGDASDFSESKWGRSTRFDGATWGDKCKFFKTIWGNDCGFRQARWGQFCNFEGAKWGDMCRFQNSTWGSHCVLDDSEWGDLSNFQNANFGSYVHFQSCVWGGGLHFWATQFGLQTIFRGSIFLGSVKFVSKSETKLNFNEIDFSGCEFRGKAEFSGRSFIGKTNFGLTDNKNKKCLEIESDGRIVYGENGYPKFINIEVPIRPVVFSVAPLFHGSELHQDTSFEGAQFPPASGSEEAARAYRTLKLAFSKQQAIREEQRFFRLEMEEETLRETGLKRWLFQAYKTFSDYGFSVTRPLMYGVLGVLCLTLVYGLLSWLGQCVFSTDACHFVPQWLEFSLLQTLPLPGLDKLSEVASKAFWPVGAWWSLGLSALVIVHKTISLAALFLIGLALRNLFKLK